MQNRSWKPLRTETKCCYLGGNSECQVKSKIRAAARIKSDQLEDFWTMAKYETNLNLANICTGFSKTWTQTRATVSAERPNWFWQISSGGSLNTAHSTNKPVWTNPVHLFVTQWRVVVLGQGPTEYIWVWVQNLGRIQELCIAFFTFVKQGLFLTFPLFYQKW